MDNIILFIGVGAYTVFGAGIGCAIAKMSASDYDGTKRKIFISAITVSGAVAGGHIGYILGRAAGL